MRQRSKSRRNWQRGDQPGNKSSKVPASAGCGIKLAQEQCLELEGGICHAGKFVCDICPEKSSGTRRRIEKEFKESIAAANERARTILLCLTTLITVLSFFCGRWTDQWIASRYAELYSRGWFAFALFCTFAFMLRMRTAGRVVTGGMENAGAFSAGIALIFFAGQCSSDKFRLFGWIILMLLGGIYALREGIADELGS